MDDVISRQAAIDALERRKDKTAKGEIGSFYNTIIQHDIDAIVELPSAQPKRKKGTWIHQVRFGRIECDQCGKVYRNTFSPKDFCPNCGADMRPREEEQDE